VAPRVAKPGRIRQEAKPRRSFLWLAHALPGLNGQKNQRPVCLDHQCPKFQRARWAADPNSIRQATFVFAIANRDA